jgi:MFS family permease
VSGEEAAARQLADVRASLAEKKIKVGFASLFSPGMRSIMLIAFGIAFFQQITGINAIFYYLPTIFAQAGGALGDAFGQAVLVGIVNVGMTLVAIWLIDRLGRKPLLTIGVTGMAVSLLTISWAFSQAHYEVGERFAARAAENGTPAALVQATEALNLPVYTSEREYVEALETQLGAAEVAPHRQALIASALDMNAQLVLIAIIGFVASFAISLGPVMWVLLSEIFPNESRGAAIWVVGFWNATISATVTFIFPWELSKVGSAGTFLVYGLFAVAALIFVLLFVKETKGRTLEQLENELVRTAHGAH